jgi:hypothetical protein
VADDQATIQAIELHRDAPPKPKLGHPCNGCGLCCAAETCPVGRVIFLRKAGPCPALVWDQSSSRYWCGMVSAPDRYLTWLPKSWAKSASPLFARWISADMACDSNAELIDDPA